jgi:hypothetical protein
MQHRDPRCAQDSPAPSRRQSSRRGELAIELGEQAGRLGALDLGDVVLVLVVDGLRVELKASSVISAWVQSSVSATYKTPLKPNPCHPTGATNPSSLNSV